MFSNIFLNKENLIYNTTKLKEKAEGELCVMVKANAYGHGSQEIVKILSGTVSNYGVSSQSEAEEIRSLTNGRVIVFGTCEDYQKCIEEDISFALFSVEQAKNIIKIYRKIGKMPRMHLCINSGMNRYGVRDKKDVTKIISLLSKESLELEGIYTHFSSLTTDKDYTERQIKIFKDYCALLPKTWKTIKHVGGGMSIILGIEADMHRVGLEIYGYGNDFARPVLSIESQIVDLQTVKKGEHIGYLCGYTAQKDMVVATIPLGYGDGLQRKLSNKLEVTIKRKTARNVGNICMDAFMVDVTNIKCKIGDRVKILDNATGLAKILETTEYEVLTNLTKFRGERKII